MLEAFAKLTGSIVIDLIKEFLRKPRLRLLCNWSNEPNTDGVGNFLALSIKIINPGSEAIFFERIEATDNAGEIFYPAFSLKTGASINPRNNIIGLIPCGHVWRHGISEIRIFDATEKVHLLKGRKLKESVNSLLQEMNRLESAGLAIHPTSNHI